MSKDKIRPFYLYFKIAVCYDLSMVITYHGLEFVKITFGDITIAFNPVSKSSDYKSSSFGADMAFISLNDPDFNGWQSLARGEKEPFVINGPGEYEFRGVFVRGFPSFSSYKNKKRPNTFYNVILEETSICFLGAISSENIKDHLNALEEEVDILFIPIGGDGVLSAAEAYKTAVGLESKIIIPIHFNFNGDKNSLKTFLKEGGEENLKPVEKLSLRKKDLVGKQGEIVVLSQG